MVNVHISVMKTSYMLCSILVKQVSESKSKMSIHSIAICSVFPMYHVAMQQMENAAEQER